MKKIILSSLIVMAGMGIAQAQSTPDTVTKDEPTKETGFLAQNTPDTVTKDEPTKETVFLAQSTQDTYVEVSIEALPEAVSASVKANYAECTIKSVAFNEAKRIYRLVLLNKDSQEQVVLMNEEGKVQE